MAKNITLMGASYSDVPAVQLPQTGGGTARFDDCSVVTAVASDVAQGKVFVASDGTVTTGTASGGITPTGTINITQNGTVDVTNYASAIVNVSGGGSSAWTKVAETSYQVTYSNTQTATVETWETGHSELWTSDKIVYVRVRDTAGKRAGYFYGVDQFFFNYTKKNHPNYSGVGEYLGMISNIWRCGSDGLYAARYGYSSTGYGVYADTFYDDGRIRIRKRYNSSYTLTIDGTYKVEVYLLDPAGGVPIFE